MINNINVVIFTVLCLTCLHCNGITQARQCRRVEECGAGEVRSMSAIFLRRLVISVKFKTNFVPPC